MSEITLLLEQIQSGDSVAKDRLFTLLYTDLKRLARGHLAKSGPITLDPSSIVHEAWLRCGDAPGGTSRRQFFAYASAVMRSVIVDHVRERAAQKRGGGVADVTLSTAAFDELPNQPDAVSVDEALQALGRIDERGHKLVEMRYFGGMTMEEIAEVMELSVPTLKRDWRRARAFLFDYLSARGSRWPGWCLPPRPGARPWRCSTAGRRPTRPSARPSCSGCRPNNPASTHACAR